MEEARLDDAVQRVSAAMDRLEAALATRPAQIGAPRSSQHELELISQREKMHSDVRETLAALDDLISGLEK